MGHPPAGRSASAQELLGGAQNASGARPGRAALAVMPMASGWPSRRSDSDPLHGLAALGRSCLLLRLARIGDGATQHYRPRSARTMGSRLNEGKVAVRVQAIEVY